MVRSDDGCDEWEVHSHGRSGAQASAMTFPLVGNSLLAQALLRRRGGLEVTSVMVSEAANGGIVPLLVPFAWLQIAVR
jgi:hypothetical protein